MQLNSTNSPFSEEQLSLLNKILPTLSPEQENWLSGYLLSQSERTQAEETQPNETMAEEQSLEDNSNSSDEVQETNKDSSSEGKGATLTERPEEITILFGTETGNAECVAEDFEEKLKAHDFKTHLYEMDEFSTEDLPHTSPLFIICSTQGVGEPPINALDTYEYLHSDEAPDMSQVNFSVLALGDQDFDNFCQAGKDFDHILGELGGNRLSPRVDCDFDFEETSEQWMDKMLDILNASGPVSHSKETNSDRVNETEKECSKETTPSEPSAVTTVSSESDHTNEAMHDPSSPACVITSSPEESVTKGDVATPSEQYTKANPFQSKVIDNVLLNKPGSNKEVHHLELEIDPEKTSYEPGDILAIIPHNDPELVDDLIQTLDWKADTEIPVNLEGEVASLKEALIYHFEITKLTPALLTKAGDMFNNAALSESLLDDGWAKSYAYGRDFVDLLRDFPPEHLEPKLLQDILRKMPPREYSISSSNLVTPSEVHITVSAVRYHSHGRDRHGVCSVQIADRLKPGDEIPIYFRKNPNFKFPFEDKTPVIMIGAGTGIAPYRAYLQEAEHRGLKKDSWLIFGNQYRKTDYLYQEELEHWLDKGYLTKLDLAFSRETKDKVYVQHLILENSETIYNWIINGAALFVCGDKDQMATGVHDAILEVLQKEGHFTEKEAEKFTTKMRKEQRYQRDVY
ncbi:flavodoxin domain-containing protein [Staphylococcus marylandisciuri]|uniref:flavodoxin domain-containing protein n=1 Tax=Staphylococcus marylandisciuri TaxID=2981529 RepID=UPI0027B9C03A